jgi:PAS domain S-box-containing protein
MSSFSMKAAIDGLLAHSDVIIALVRGTDHRLVFASDSLAAMTACPPCLGMRAAELVPERLGKGLLRHLDKVLHTGRPVRARRYEMKPPSDGKRSIWLNCEFIPVPAGDGEQAGVLMIACDISSEVEAATRAKYQAALLDTIMRMAPVGLTVADLQNSSVRVSDHGRRLLGLGECDEAVTPRDYFNSMTLRRHGSSEIIPSGQFPTARAIRGEVVVDEELDVLLPNGAIVPIATYASPIRKRDGTIAGAITAMLDISEREAAERRLREALAAKDALLRELAHRVKNNFQIVASMLMMHAIKSSHPEVRDQLEQAINRIRSLANIHERLYRRDCFDGRVELDAALRGMSEDTGNCVSGDIRFHLDLAALAMTAECATPVLLLANEVVSNAVKHAFPHGKGGSVSIRLEQRADFGVLTVTDDGVGLPADFERRNSLGIVLIRTLANQAEARLEIGRDGSGSSFRITFPIARPQGSV